MNTANPISVEQLQLQLEAQKAKTAQLEKLIQDKLNADSLALQDGSGNFTAPTQSDYQLSNHGIDNSRKISIPRSRSTMGYVAPHMASSMTVKPPISTVFKLNIPFTNTQCLLGTRFALIPRPQAATKSFLSAGCPSTAHEPQHLKSFRVTYALCPAGTR